MEVDDSLATMDGRQFSPAWVMAYSKRHNVDELQARRELALHERAEPFLEQVVAAFPTTFAGSWIVGDNLHVAFTAHAEESLESVRDVFFRPEALVAETSSVSQMKMMAANDALWELDEALMSLGVSSYGYDVKTESFYIYIRSTLQQRQVSALVGSVLHPLGVPYSVRTGGLPQRLHIPPSDLVCRPSVFYHCNPVRGGAQLHTSTTTAGPSATPPTCTMGYNGHVVGLSNSYILTAGHCNHNWFHSDSDLADFHERRIAGRCDCGRERLWSAWSSSRWVIFEPDALTTYQAFQIRNRSAADGVNLHTPLGTDVCLTGASSTSLIAIPSSCGTVVLSPFTIMDASGSTTSQFAIAGASAIPGDSGGPVFSDSLARGIIVARETVTGDGGAQLLLIVSSYVRRAELDLAGGDFRITLT